MTIREQVSTATRDRLEDMIREHPHWIKYLEEQDDDLMLIALEANPNVLCLVRDQSEELCLAAVRRVYTTIAYVRKLTDKIVTTAMSVDSDAQYYLPQNWYDLYGRK